MIDYSFLKIWDRRLFGHCGGGALASTSSRRGYKVTAPHDNFMDNPQDPVGFRRELALLNRALDKNVVALVERHGDAGEVTVERQVVPVSVLLWFSVRVLVSVTLAKAGVGDGRSRRKISGGWLTRQIADHFKAVSLHVVLFALLFKLKFFHKAVLHAGEALIA